MTSDWLRDDSFLVASFILSGASLNDSRQPGQGKNSSLKICRRFILQLHRAKGGRRWFVNGAAAVSILCCILVPYLIVCFLAGIFLLLIRIIISWPRFRCVWPGCEGSGSHLNIFIETNQRTQTWPIRGITSHLNVGGRGRWKERIRVKERDWGRGPESWSERSVSQTLAQSSVVSWGRGGRVGGYGGQRVVIGARRQIIGRLSDKTNQWIDAKVSC